jgi:hypothetical protein
MDSDAMIYISSSIEIGSGIQTLIGGYTDTKKHGHTDGIVIEQAAFL